MGFIKYSYLVPIIPLIGAAVNGMFSFAGVKRGRWVVSVIACGTVLSSFIIGCGLFYELHLLTPEARTIVIKFFTWFDLPIMKADVAFLIDPLSVAMTLVVAGVGFLIHLYSVGYMANDPGYARFFSYLNLFCFAMLLLVLADNLLLMFVGWEGVGLCSYLLIGFWFEHEPNAAAGMKAFIVNRIGDMGFLVGIMVLFWAMWSMGKPTVAFTELREASYLLGGLTFGPASAATLVCILLFVGAAGKSAQIPLYVWLPDAMAGPTPVSALIHAATMVTAGVYMIGRMNFLYTMSPTALTVVAIVGVVTAVFAASIGFAQNDIKRILAYSTISQLGYMFLGMGTGVYAAGIFHLVTHAFFKACLFLAAGSVILGMHHEQDIQKMGGLKRYMPITFWTFLAATLALSGVFPFSGFFSKDDILWQVFSKGKEMPIYYILWGLGLAGVIGTSFYMFRCVGLTFLGDIKNKSEVPKEQSVIITGVLAALAVLSVAGGLIGIPNALGRFVGLPNYFEGWLDPVFNSPILPSIKGAEGGFEIEYLLILISFVLAISGIILATWFYTRRRDIVEILTNRFRTLYKMIFNKYYIDEFYHWLIVKRLLWLNEQIERFDQVIIDGFVNKTAALGVYWSVISGWLDSFFVDGVVNLVANATIASGRKLRRIQTGRIQHYFYIVLFGLIAMFIWSKL